MPRKLVNPERSKALVNAAWDRVKESAGCPPNWPYMACCQLVDMMLAADPDIDGRDISDALVLCHGLDVTPTKSTLAKNMQRVERGRQGVHAYK